MFALSSIRAKSLAQRISTATRSTGFRLQLFYKSILIKLMLNLASRTKNRISSMFL